MSEQKLIQSLIPNPEELQKQVANEFNSYAHIFKINRVDMQLKKGKLTLGEKVGLMKYKEIELLFSHSSMCFKFRWELNSQLIEKIEPILNDLQNQFGVSFILPNKRTYLKRINGEWSK